MVHLRCLGLMMLLARATNMGAQNAQELLGCWEASRPIGSRADPSGVPSEARFQTLRLSDSGRVHLPLLERSERTMWEARSTWSQRNDSLTLRVFTGLVGWRLQLLRESRNSWRGTATYLTDVIVRGQPPLRVPMVLTRKVCDPSWLLPVSPVPLRRPSLQPYFDFQVERPVQLRSPLPAGVGRFVQLSGKDRVTTLVNATVVQFVVDSTGQPQLSTLKVLRSMPPSSAALEQALATAIGTMSFMPAMVANRTVAQLTQWRIEWR